jgi:deoxyribodipyrimidine photo-lyase
METAVNQGQMNNKRALFIFRRDLRLADNNGLIFAKKMAKEVIPAFIFTPEQIEKNPYRSDHCLRFMHDCLEELDEELRSHHSQLFFFHGEPHEVVERIIAELKVEAVVVNRDYTPYSRKRDEKIAAVCQKMGVHFSMHDDALLHPPEKTLKANGEPYTIFTPFWRNAQKFKVDAPHVCHATNYYRGKIPFATSGQLNQEKSLSQPGGRSEALKILKKIENFTDYAAVRDYPAQEKTTHLSAHLKFTTCSPREIYQAFCTKLTPHHELVRALYWRDFFTSIAFFFPHVFKGAFHQEYDNLPWSEDKSAFKRWCQGQSGFPLVDAGLREMNQTGFMHNRVRMVVASFLTKDLHLNWRWGEKYFAQTLVDYDPAVNNGNWQWAASTGCDAQPYFRIFNPWNQQKKFDPDCLYIKRYLPELEALPPEVIHNWHLEKHWPLCPAYPPPMVSHAEEAAIALSSYRKLRG